MITNERQYNITRVQADRFQHAVDEFNTHPRDGVHPLLVKAERDALESQLEDLRAEIDEYERLKSADTSVISAASSIGNISRETTKGPRNNPARKPTLAPSQKK